jgi:hypothetical protein
MSSCGRSATRSLAALSAAWASPTLASCVAWRRAVVRELLSRRAVRAMVGIPSFSTFLLPLALRRSCRSRAACASRRLFLTALTASVNSRRAAASSACRRSA